MKPDLSQSCSCKNTKYIWIGGVEFLRSHFQLREGGLEKGDLITAINGHSVKEISFEERQTLFVGLSGITFTIHRGDTSQDINLYFDEPKI